MRLRSVLLATALVATVFVGSTPTATAVGTGSTTVTPMIIAPIEGGGAQNCTWIHGYPFCF